MISRVLPSIFLPFISQCNCDIAQTPDKELGVHCAFQWTDYQVHV